MYKFMFPKNKTKIICTIGPASRSPEIIRSMLHEGMNIARLNFSHGEFNQHAADIKTIREVAGQEGIPVTIMADLPGPKIRIGELTQEPLELKKGQELVLTTQQVLGTCRRISVPLPTLPSAVKKGDRIYINDGFIQLTVTRVSGDDVLCRVLVGGMIRSRKGLNVPDVDLGISAFTDHDRRCLSFAKQTGIEAVSQSFVENAGDIEMVQQTAEAMKYDPFIIAKIERSRAVEELDAILAAADGIMVARGDLGVEIPIEKIPSVQKKIMGKANQACKPVITATQMLESMVFNRLPTRAESTDVANAIIDGTDCVMLSGESAIGEYPVEAVGMLSAIAREIEPRQKHYAAQKPFQDTGCPVRLQDVIARSVAASLDCINPEAVFTPTRSGATARRVSRFRPGQWVVAVSSRAKTCSELLFSYGVIPVHEPNHPENWKTWVSRWLAENNEKGELVVLTEGPSGKYPNRNNRMEILDLRDAGKKQPRNSNIPVQKKAAG